MNTTTLTVPTITCDHCKSSIEGAVGGVSDVTVDVAGKRVDVAHDDSVSIDEIVSSIEDQGYDVPR